MKFCNACFSKNADSLSLQCILIDTIRDWQALVMVIYRRKSISWISDSPGYWRRYASLGFSLHLMYNLHHARFSFTMQWGVLHNLAVWVACLFVIYYSDVIMRAKTSQITGVSIVNSTVCIGADQRKRQNSSSLVFVRGTMTGGFPSQRDIHWPLWCEFHRWPVNSAQKGPVTRKMFPFEDVIMDTFSLGGALI